MNNQGKITVFLSLMVSVMLVMAICVLSVIDRYMARGRIAMSSRTALSGIMAEYNSYIYEHYHILLIDKAFGGKGEGYLEEKFMENLRVNLGDSFTVEDVAISDFTLISDDGCEALKSQAADYIGYAAIEYGAEQILSSTGGRDGSLDAELSEELDAGEQDAGNTEPTEETDDNETLIESSKSDPRDTSESLEGLGLLAVVCPSDIEFSDRILTVDDRPSLQMTGIMSDIFSVNNSFDSYSDLKDDLRSHGTWKDSLLDAGVGISYAANVFNCAVDNSVNDTSVLKCELEYLICGKKSDIENVKGAVNRIIAVRLPVNYTFLMSDPSKSSELTSLSTSLMVTTGIPEPILKRLLAGAWAYVEAVAEMKNLMAGHKLDFNKNTENWITDLNRLGDSIYDVCESDDDGLGYKDYLLILMALDMNKVYYRMLDIMQLNAREEHSDFSIMNSVVSLSLDLRVSHDGITYGLQQQAEY